MKTKTKRNGGKVGEWILGNAKEKWVLSHICGGLYLGSCDGRNFVTTCKKEAVYWVAWDEAAFAAKELELSPSWVVEKIL